MFALDAGGGSDGKLAVNVLSLVSAGTQSYPEILLEARGDVYVYINHAFQFLC